MTSALSLFGFIPASLFGLAAMTQSSVQIESTAEVPTFTADVAPILFARCVECHREGGGAPFALTTYDAARRKARTIARVVEDRIMPPWPAAQGSSVFRHARRLEDAEVATIRRWVEGGRPEGDAARFPPLPPPPGSWPLGEPDQVLRTPAPFPVPADGRDIYRYFALPLDLAEDRWLSAVDIRSSAPSVVHHVLFFLDASRSSRDREGQGGKPGFSGRSRGRPLSGWAVGWRAQRFPLDLGHALGRGGDLILQVHFHPDGRPHEATLEVALYFCPAPPQRELLEFQLPPEFGSRAGIDIPAGEAHYEVSDCWTTPADIDLLSVWAHAHMVCVSAAANAELPDGRTIDLLTIPRWNFNWQMRYDYLAPLRLPKGTRITGRLRYDNSASNPNNPNIPPQRVTWGEQTTDEMGSLIFNCAAAREEDKPALVKSSIEHASQRRR